MDTHYCLKEKEWGELQSDLRYIKENTCRHIQEGEGVGGWRDRLLVVEQETSTLKKSYWKTCVVAGIIGGLVGNISPEIFNFFVRFVLANGH